MVVKKYGNRRLYDTEASRYVTLDEVEARVRRGDDVDVIDAKTGRDITQATLAQIILESRGAARLLPVPLLRQLIRMGDDAVAEFFERTVIWALDIYLYAKKGAQVFPFGPLGALPLLNALLGGSNSPWSTSRDRGDRGAHHDGASDLDPDPGAEPHDGPPPSEPSRHEHPRDDQADQLVALRQEVDELKRLISKK